MPERPSLENVDSLFDAEDEGVAGPLRDHVSFRAVGDAVVTPMDAAADLVDHVRLGNKGRSAKIRVRLHRSYSGAVTVRVSRLSDRFHTIKFSSTADGGLLANHNVVLGRPLSLLLHDWLTASDRFTGICWRTRDQWRSGELGQDTLS